MKNNTIVIAGGGGGVPVYKDGHSLIGIDAVVDKDFTSSKIAELIDANRFIILTAVDQIKINYSKPNEKSLSVVSLPELEKYISEDQFAPGSMLPKVRAAMKFVQKVGTPAYIGQLKDAHKIIIGKAGTKIVIKN
jgi:carbamate kinase